MRGAQVEREQALAIVIIEERILCAQAIGSSESRDDADFVHVYVHVLISYFMAASLTDRHSLRMVHAPAKWVRRLPFRNIIQGTVPESDEPVSRSESKSNEVKKSTESCADSQ